MLSLCQYKSINNHLCHSIPVTFNGDFHKYYTRSRNDIRKSSTRRRWGHWSSVNFSADIWNGRLDTSLRNAESLSAFKRGLSKVIFDSHLLYPLYIIFNFYVLVFVLVIFVI